MKQITIISDFCYPNFAGGSSKHVFDLLMNFPEEEFNLKLVTRSKNPGSDYFAKDEKAEEHYVRFFQKGNVKEMSLGSIINPFRYIGSLKNTDYVLLQYPVMGVVGGLVAKLMGKKIYYHYHGPAHIEYKYKTGKEGFRYKLMWGIQKITAMLSDRVLVHSDYMKDIAIKEHKIRESKFGFVPPYIDKTLTSDKKEITRSENEKIQLLIPRRLTARTGVIEFLDQFLKSDKNFRDKFIIYVTGCGELAPEVTKLADSNPEHIKFLGFVSYDELKELYHQVDGVIVPTLDLEGCGLVILEALSCGTSVIVSKTCGGGYEFVRKNMGKDFIFDVFDHESVIRTLEFIAKKSYDPEYYKDIASRYDIKKMIKHYTNDILN